MFKIKKIEDPIHLYFISKHPFPIGISSAWTELERHMTERSRVKFFGIFDGQKYFACCDNPGRIDISRESLQEYIVPTGSYLAHKILSWQDKKEQIALTFQQMEEDSRCNRASDDIEFYKSNDELVCLKATRT